MNNDKTSDISLTLVPLCRVTLELAPPRVLSDGPSGKRMIATIKNMHVVGERLRGELADDPAADWLTIIGDVAHIDVRATLMTHDDAAIFIQYRGRTNVSQGLGSHPIYVTPVFETADPRYAWLNHVQAAGKGDLKTLTYEWFELR